MKVQILQENLSKTLSLCSRFSSSAVQLPILTNLLFKTQKNKLIISATNLETSISVSIGAKIEKEGKIAIPARIITELASHLGGGQLSLEVEKEVVRISSVGFESTISAMDASDFPNVPDDVGLDALTLPFDKFSESLSLCLFAAGTDETRPVLTGLLIILNEDKLTMVSTDGFRLSQVITKIEGIRDSKRFIVPKNALSEVLRLPSEEGELKFSFKKVSNQVVFASANAVLSSRIIEGEFPDFEKIIPRNTKIKVKTDKEELLRAVKLASVFARDSANVVKIRLLEGGFELLAESSQLGNERTQIDASIDGVEENFLIAFNYRFLEDLLNALKGDSVDMEFSDPNSPALFLDPKDPNFLHIIMPVRLAS